MSLKDKILASQDVKLVPVEVPEWGCTVYVKTDTIADAIADLKAREDDDRDGILVNAERRIFDEKGNRIFANGEGAALLGKSLSALRRITEAHAALNGTLPTAPDSPKN